MNLATDISLVSAIITGIATTVAVLSFCMSYKNNKKNQIFEKRKILLQATSKINEWLKTRDPNLSIYEIYTSIKYLMLSPKEFSSLEIIQEEIDRDFRDYISHLCQYYEQQKQTNMWKIKEEEESKREFSQKISKHVRNNKGIIKLLILVLVILNINLYYHEQKDNERSNLFRYLRYGFEPFLSSSTNGNYASLLDNSIITIISEL